MSAQQQTCETNKKKLSNPRIFLARLQEKIASCPSSYLFFCFLVPVVIMFFVYVAMRIHPFGDGSVLTLDLNAQYVYFHEALRNTLCGDGDMLYSFYRNMGGEFMGIYAYYVASPFNILLLLFPQSRILEALLTIILLKVGFCGYTFGYYLNKHTKHPNRPIVVCFSVMYALCAYAVVYQNNIMWMDALILLPLITYGVEQLIRLRKYKLFVITLALALMSNYYIGYMLCLFVVLYFFYYMFSHTKEEINPLREKLHRTKSFARIAGFSALAIAISAFIIFCAYYSLSFGKDEFTRPSWDLNVKTDFLDLFTKFLPGAYDNVRTSGLPYVYCGVLTLILVPVYFMSKKITAREKAASAVFIAIFIISFMASPLDLIWHGFQNPNWLNFRYSFMLSFILLIMAYKGFGNLRAVGDKFVFGVTALLVFCITVCDKIEFDTYLKSDGELDTLKTVWLAVFAAVAFLVMLCLIMRQKNVFKREGLAGILAAIVCIEIFCSSLAYVEKHQKDVGGYTGGAVYTNYTTYVVDLRPIVNDLKEYDSGFYRAEKMSFRKVNDNMALGLRGLSSSTSTLNRETIDFLSYLGYSARSHRSVYDGGTPVSDSLLGIKYLIDSSDQTRLDSMYEKVLSNGKYSAYQNPYALSIAFGVDSSVSDFKMDGNHTSHFNRMNNMVASMLGDKKYPDLFVSVKRSNIERYYQCAQDYQADRITYSPLYEDRTNYMEYTFVAPKSAEYYFHSHLANSQYTETQISVGVMDPESGKTSLKKLGGYLGSDSLGIVTLGTFNEGDTITVRITLGDGSITVLTYPDYIWYLDQEVFEAAFAQLKSNPQFEITEYTERNLKGNIKTEKEAQTIQTTIPYDEGWKVYVDGKEVEIYKTFDALIAFDIDTAGEHTLELKYSPKIYKVGITISVIGLIAFIAICAVDFVILRRRKKQKVG